MGTITYQPDGAGNPAPITLPIGKRYEVKREGACLDICLQRVVAIDCPLVVSILIRTTGEVVLWGATWNSREANTYWHFGAGSDDDAKKRRPTDWQLVTLERMFLGLAGLPGGLNGALGAPVAGWAFAGQTPATVAAKHGVKTPIMNG